MTAKEKAIELVDKYVILLHKETPCVFDFNKAKQCALIAVDEIINLDALTDEGFLPVPQEYKVQYWMSVRKEIEKL